MFLGQFYWIPPILLRDEVNSVVDLGAHIGLTTLYFAQYFPMARFVCVEPNPANVEILKRNILWLGERVRVIEGAISNHSGEENFDDSGWSWGGHLSGSKQLGRMVRCYTMEEIIETSGLDKIDILKVDIEGAEQQLFGSENKWLRKIRMIIIELHGTYSMEQFDKDMTSMGFKILPPNSDYGNRMIIAIS